MTKEEKKRVSEQLIFTHIRMGNYKLAERAMCDMDTSRLYVLERDANLLGDLINEIITKRTDHQHIPEQLREEE